MTMELPDEMPEEMKELIRKIEEKGIVQRLPNGDILGGFAVPRKRPDYSTWVQVATLTSEEKMMHKKALLRGKEIAHEDRVLLTKHQRLLAEVEEIQAVLWHKIEKTHSLPFANFHIMEDGRIVMEPGSAGKAKREGL